MSSYQFLFEQVVQIANGYSLATMFDGFNPELINILLREHLDDIKKADSYDTAIRMMNEAATQHLRLGVAIRVENFITKGEDRTHLYELFKTWRELLLQEYAI